MKTFFKTIGIGIIILIAISAIYSLFFAEPKSSNQNSITNLSNSDLLKEIEKREKQTISAIDLVTTYKENEVRADGNYKGKTFYITGIVGDIKKDIMDNIYVTLEGEGMFNNVQCFIKDIEAASKLEKGMEVTFFGECDGLMINVIFKNCKLVQNLSELKKLK